MTPPTRYLITGATSGIGAATAEYLADAGHHVLATGRNPETLEAAKTRFAGKNIEVIQSDAADLDSISELLRYISEQGYPLDGAFLNAGIAPFAPIEHTDEASFDRLFDVNVKGPFFLVQKLIPLLKNPSSLLFNTSVAANIGIPNSSAYAGSKGALQSMMRVFAVELASRGIRSNAIAPGPIETPIYGKLGLPEEEVQAMGAHMGSRVPLQRFGSAEETAKVAAFLLSPDAAYVNGSEYAVDGGMQLNVV